MKIMAEGKQHSEQPEMTNKSNEKTIKETVGNPVSSVESNLRSVESNIDLQNNIDIQKSYSEELDDSPNLFLITEKDSQTIESETPNDSQNIILKSPGDFQSNDLETSKGFQMDKHGMLKEFLVMTNEKGEKVTLENEGLDSVISKDESELTDEERMLLYHKAMSFKGLGSNNHALLCFLGCLKGLKPSSKSKFTMLPQCLTHISEIYALAGDYQRAVEFMQGTKLYYETAIIEAGMQVDKYKEKTSEEYRPLDFDPCLDEAKRANEYERLTNSCLEQKKFQLALEYCGKATKLRQTAYGDEHPLTVKSLDLFTLIYAEMGKCQYSEAMQKVGDIVKEFKEEKENNADEKLKVAVEDEIKPESTTLEGTEPTNDGQQKHENSEETSNDTCGTVEEENSKNKKHVTFKQPITDEYYYEKAPSSFSTLQLIMFIVASAIIAVVITIAWCRISKSTSCPRGDYLYSKLKFLYYYYMVPSDPDTSYI